MPGRPTLVFFGYTHCPDVCPETVGVLEQAVSEAGPGPRALFVSIDPERDDVAAMKAYTTYLPDWLIGLTGTPAEVAANAARWGVKYAKVEEGTPPDYGMAHTADVFLVDAAGRLRAKFPFGTKAEAIASFLRRLEGEAALAVADPRPLRPGPRRPLPHRPLRPRPSLPRRPRRRPRPPPRLRPRPRSSRS